ncbi:ribosome-associated translation inhibitor RaiA (plasmid) [Paenibacillus thiaminolyticus]|uniref:ribosome hibernation-promoting factor, HPF/YfiA family n=1 Tax=Paenibacillus thiaminolyticus TaxID=49283 RepID=UPI00232FDD2C|nr:ribosome-associated translation inhibitor RaiA [Paenibacillus thiaminolyticus]WCF11744.1 ribosome-associated translation inhibitor RaiA [Paenibacillus thiaminolyticus]
MNIKITARNFELTFSINTAIEEGLKKASKFLPPENNVQVVLQTSKHGKKIEIMTMVHGSFIKSEVEDKDLYAAIDLATEKLIRKLAKITDIRNNKCHQSIRYSNFDTATIHPEIKATYERITKRKQFNMKPMMEEEAVLQMEMLGHDTFMFFNGETNKMCLLYKRKDGNFGLIESRY